MVMMHRVLKFPNMNLVSGYYWVGSINPRLLRPVK